MYLTDYKFKDRTDNRGKDFYQFYNPALQSNYDELILPCFFPHKNEQWFLNKTYFSDASNLYNPSFCYDRNCVENVENMSTRRIKLILPLRRKKS